MASDNQEPFELSKTFIHLSPGSRATPLPDFDWAEVGAYRDRFAGDGPDGRLVCVVAQDATWDGWERHPGGEEVVVLLSGRVDLVQEIDGAERVIELHPGEALINPANVWHTARVHEPGLDLFITPGDGTEFKPIT
jgi:mannose-6-phosphate isomerase-like protein (cupin superfamily)